MRCNFLLTSALLYMMYFFHRSSFGSPILWYYTLLRDSHMGLLYLSRMCNQFFIILYHFHEKKIVFFADTKWKMKHNELWKNTSMSTIVFTFASWLIFVCYHSNDGSKIWRKRVCKMHRKFHIQLYFCYYMFDI